MLKISDLSPQKLESGFFSKQLPELYNLKKVVECNAWHRNQSVFTHSVQSYSSLTSLLDFSFVEGKKRKRWENYFGQPIGAYRRKELLLLAGIFHDIGKQKSFLRANNGDTFCPWHEEIGGKMITGILPRFGLSGFEIAYVTNIIRHHAWGHEYINLYINGFSPKICNTLVGMIASECLPDLVLHSYADALGSDARETVPEDFSLRERFIKEFFSL